MRGCKVASWQQSQTHMYVFRFQCTAHGERLYTFTDCPNSLAFKPITVEMSWRHAYSTDSERLCLHGRFPQPHDIARSQAGGPHKSRLPATSVKLTRHRLQASENRGSQPIAETRMQWLSENMRSWPSWQQCTAVHRVLVNACTPSQTQNHSRSGERLHRERRSHLSSGVPAAFP